MTAIYQQSIVQACKHSLICRRLNTLYLQLQAIVATVFKRLQIHLFLIINLQAYSKYPLGVHCLPKLVKCCIGRCQILMVGDLPSSCCCSVILSIPSNTSTNTTMKNCIHGFMASSTVCYRQKISLSVEYFL